jgi:hypothetical protein
MMRGRAPGGVMRSMPLYGVFAALLAYLSARRSPAATEGRLIDCVACGTDYVCAVDWEETDDVHWWIRLRCGACGTVREVVVADDDAGQLDRALSVHTAMMERALAQLDRERMVADIDVFVAALDRDLIDPSSFAA